MTKQAVAKGGRDDERGLFDRPDDYVRSLDKRAKGQPCHNCSTTMERTQHLGGSCCFCPDCRP